MKNIKRWIPFIVLIGLALSTSGFLIFAEGEDVYKPRTDNPAKIYREACSHCHGKRGEGTGLLYQAFDHNDMTLKSVRESIREGAFLMPAFVHIRKDTLEILAQYILDKGYLKPGYKPVLKKDID